ncbi:MULTISPECIES: sulfatase [Haloferax]|uniref:Sulfatase-like hydrolase/transferase n=2 Tax=Haloferax TaxID=2251 RepID=A0A6G1Z0X9_9EURY|nr:MULTISPECIES: sulfatase [Haloferax]KAB1187520.1 sulfatase [Haloferax sp. CBA1149]MRW80172.1 sulfatase-like hydrolase/transferase [Haloferax marinisediminis]
MADNVVVVTLDSVRADHTTVGGYSKNTTPTLEQLAQVNFLNARSNAPCTPHSMPSALTGLLPLSDGVLALQEKDTIPKYLQESGYQTCFVNSNIQIPRFNYHSDFGTHIDFSNISDDSSESSRIASEIFDKGKKFLDSGGVSGKIGVMLKDSYHRFAGVLQPHVEDQKLVEEAIDWMSAVEEPFFIWIHFMDTHYPYNFAEEHFEQVSEFSFNENRYARLLTRAMTHTRKGNFVWELDKEQQQYLRDAYDASILQADENISKLVDEIDLDSTLFICSSDHGEELWDHGCFGHAGRPSIPREMTLYEEMLRIPLVFAGDVPVQDEKEISAPVSLLDLAPTILSEAGTELTSRNFHGQNILQDSIKEDREIIAHSTSPGDPVDFNNNSNSKWLASLIKYRTKMVIDSRDNREIFNVENGREQPLNDLCEENREEYLTTINNSVSLSHSDENIEINENTEERLKELGYLG